MEKSSKIIITQKDLDAFYLGTLPDRLKAFGINSLEEFQRILEAGEYTLEP